MTSDAIVVSTRALESEENLAADDAEHTLTSALSALKRRGTRVATRVESAIAPTRTAIGVTFAIGLGALVLFAVVRRRRPRRAPSFASSVARSIVKEVAGRVMIGAAAAVGARLAETVVVPLLVASISSRRASRERRSKRILVTPA